MMTLLIQFEKIWKFLKINLMKFDFGLLLVPLMFIAFSCKQVTNQETSGTSTPNRYEGPIIDMHVHSYGENYPMLGFTHPPTLRGQTFQGVKTAAELKHEVLERFKKYKIVKAVVTGGQRWIADAPDQILIAGSDKPIDSLKAQYGRGQLQAIAEMAPFYDGIKANDPTQLPYFELAQELKIPVGFHVLPGGPNYGFHLMPEMLGGMRAYNANPIQLEDVLIKYPNLKLYIMHGAWPYVEDVKALMYAHPNVYVDIAVLDWLLPEQECYKYLGDLIDAGFGNRIMYGSDQMVWPQIIDVGIETINSAQFLSLEEKEDIFYDNAAEFLGLTDDQIKKHKGE